MCGCMKTKTGKQYTGNISVTVSGKHCQRWDSQVPHSHKYNDSSMFPDAAVSEAGNRCRNPGQGWDGGPWCYTNNSQTKWELCDIPICECLTNKNGQQYAGTRSVTSLGYTCQRWDSQTPHLHSSSDPSLFPEKTISEAENYCRNPHREWQSGPWCYTTNPDVQWDYCDLPLCEPKQEVKVTPEDTSVCKYTLAHTFYIGTKTVTKNGKICQRWDSQTPHAHIYINHTMYPDASITEASNFCRSPDNREPGDPWCFTMDNDTRWEFCDIRRCDCRLTWEGREYTGQISVTSSGKTCQRWDSFSPNRHNLSNPVFFPDTTISAAENYCRNPDIHWTEGPWCYTTDQGTQRELCNVPICECRVTALGKKYLGTQNITKNGQRCQRWDSQHPHAHARNNAQLFLEPRVEDVHNYCRNPDHEEWGPWCYTLDPKYTWQYCYPPFCQFQKHWSKFRQSYYYLRQKVNGISWMDAEMECGKSGGHLVSIEDLEEYNFVVSLANTATYIGLTDMKQEGVFRWSDGKPLTFTDWAYDGKKSNKQEWEPKGSNTEDCVFWEPPNGWKETLCLLPRVWMSYICEIDKQLGNSSDLTIQNDNDGGFCPSFMFTCGSGECIWESAVCDQLFDCMDNSDEKQCNETDLFSCGDGKRIPWAGYCDFKADCSNGADESNCVFPDCTEAEFQCENAKCIPLERECDFIIDCQDKSDETNCGSCRNDVGFRCYDNTCLPRAYVCDGMANCPSSKAEDELYAGCTFGAISSGEFECKSARHKIDSSLVCLADVDSRGFYKGCRDGSHLENCANVTCPTGYAKCEKNFCIPYYKICDGVWDCPGREDENICHAYNCEGNYRCKGQKNCIQASQICDGEKQCLLGDDEKFCGLACPESCSCFSLELNCSSVGFMTFPHNIDNRTRKLFLSSNIITTTPLSLNLPFLVHADLSGNQLGTIQPNTFVRLRNLLTLDLSYNNLTSLQKCSFCGLDNLILLNLVANVRLKVIEPGSFIGLQRLQSLQLVNHKVEGLHSLQFRGLGSLKSLNVSGNNIETIHTNAFQSLDTLTELDISNNPIHKFDKNIFATLKNLKKLTSSHFKFCCLAKMVAPSNCFPQADEFSTCEDLMRHDILRVLLWVMGVLSLSVNGFVFVFRLKNSGSFKVHNFFISNLSLADMLMSIYLLTIAGADLVYRGSYIEHDERWRSSFTCSFVGFAATVSCMSSLLMLLLITGNTMSFIIFPFSKYHLAKVSAYTVAICAWVSTIVFAGVPIIFPDYFKGKFYGRSPVCLALHITSQTYAGWEYAVGTLTVLPFIACVIIIVLYTWMYFSIKRTALSAGKAKANHSAKLFKKMALIILSNLLCWMPICFLGFAALNSTTRIPGEIYAWFVVFVLPVNAVLNPFIYTISTLNVGARIFERIALKVSKHFPDSSSVTLTSQYSRTERESRSSPKEDVKHLTCSCPLGGPMAIRSMGLYLKERNPLSAKDIAEILKSLVLLYMQLEGTGCIPLMEDWNLILLSDEKGRLYAAQIRQTLAMEDDIDPNEGISAVGRLTSKMLRIYQQQKLNPTCG